MSSPLHARAGEPLRQHPGDESATDRTRWDGTARGLLLEPVPLPGLAWRSAPAADDIPAPAASPANPRATDWSSALAPAPARFGSGPRIPPFDAAAHGLRIGESPNQLLPRALETVMQSTDYRAAAELIGAQGGATIRFDPTISGRAHWHQPSRTINLNPDPEERARMPVAGMLAFELGNAAQSAQFQEILDEVRVGTINDGQEYARRCEMMEYRTAQLRAKASRTMI